MSRMDIGIVRRFNPDLAKGLKLLLVSGAIFAMAIALFFMDPAEGNFYPPCPFHRLTGLHCPGCGSLRAVHQLLHGHWAAAFSLNPVMVSLLPVLLYVFLSKILEAVRGRGLPRFFVPAPFIWILLGVIVLFWIMRNIPFYPFFLLAP